MSGAPAGTSLCVGPHSPASWRDLVRMVMGMRSGVAAVRSLRPRLVIHTCTFCRVWLIKQAARQAQVEEVPGVCGHFLQRLSHGCCQGSGAQSLESL